MSEWLIASLQWFDAALSAVDWQIAGTGVVSAGFGAIAGAYAAFTLESRRRASEVEAKHISDGRRVLFDLFYIWEDLAQYNNQVLSGIQGTPPEHHWIRLLPTNYPYSTEGFLEPARYEFLFEHGEPQLAADIALQHRRYVLAMSQIQERSRIIIEGVRPRWEAAQLGVDAEITAEELQQMAGPNFYHQLRDMTENIKRFVPEDLQAIEACFKSLRDHLKKRYPGRSFMDFQPLEPASEDADAQPGSKRPTPGGEDVREN